ncbi:hypothetical protein BLNAU_12072 [Blattamonas nauphoetae]|uniref:Uncharacterized protein n=1 Tax=Blattamonas nauphoetae TaxID=2049346 RepID=A0ABQ9XKZ3_9EUKA|nr:hypothetical protein BLNAU_12072 [Blattamonas nauphoetae]
MTPYDKESADAFLICLGRTTDESLTDFVQSIVILLSSLNHVIITAVMEMLKTLKICCSPQVRLALVKADLITQLITNLNPLSLSFTKAADVLINVMKIINCSILLTTPDGLRYLRITDRNEQQSVRETVLKQVVVPSETYIWHLCMNRFSIIDGGQSANFLDLLARLLEICHSSQPTMDFIQIMPIFFTIPSCLTFFEYENTIFWFMCSMIDGQHEWNETRGEVRQIGKTVHRKLKMEGIEDVIEEKLENDRKEYYGEWIVDKSIRWNNTQGINIPQFS